MLAHGLTVIVY
jgi:hypothetical protein